MAGRLSTWCSSDGVQRPGLRLYIALHYFNRRQFSSSESAKEFGSPPKSNHFLGRAQFFHGNLSEKSVHNS